MEKEQILTKAFLGERMEEATTTQLHLEALALASTIVHSLALEKGITNTCSSLLSPSECILVVSNRSG